MSNQDSPPQAKPMPPQDAIAQMILGHIVSRLIYVAAKLGLADQLKDGPKTSEELAALVEAHPGALRRVLGALATFGVFSETEDGRYGLTPLGAALRNGVPGSMRHFALMNGDEWATSTWDQMLYSVRTDKTALEHVHGMEVWEYFGHNPEARRVFDDSMGTHSAMISSAVLAAYDFSGVSTIVDVAGGQGQLVANILKAYPQMRGIVFDLAQVIEDAGGVMEAEGVADRCELVSGDMFTSVPGGDAHMLKWVLHDWQDERALSILKNCREAMGKDGRLLLVESVLASDSDPHIGALLDMFMLVMFSGRERTEVEFKALLDTTGFRLARVIPTKSPLSIIEALPV